jgi:hypothetical protein
MSIKFSAIVAVVSWLISGVAFANDSAAQSVARPLVVYVPSASFYSDRALWDVVKNYPAKPAAIVVRDTVSWGKELDKINKSEVDAGKKSTEETYQAKEDLRPIRLALRHLGENGGYFIDLFVKRNTPRGISHIFLERGLNRLILPNEQWNPYSEFLAAEKIAKNEKFDLCTYSSIAAGEKVIGEDASAAALNIAKLLNSPEKLANLPFLKTYMQYLTEERNTTFLACAKRQPYATIFVIQEKDDKTSELLGYTAERAK